MVKCGYHSVIIFKVACDYSNFKNYDSSNSETLALFIFRVGLLTLSSVLHNLTSSLISCSRYVHFIYIRSCYAGREFHKSYDDRITSYDNY